MRKIGLVAAFVLVPGVAFAGHGKAGLWNVTTTMDMGGGVQMPPEAMAQMKKMGLKMPTARSFTSQICMTQAEVDSDKLPAASKNEMNCTTHVASQTNSSMTVQTVCNGEMKGTGQTQISFSGNDHYTGSYSFKGSMNGQTMAMNSSFQGNWVKADCGAVKPYTAK